MNRIKIIIDKEWLEAFKNKLVLMTIVFMPVVFTIIPLVMVYVTQASGDSSGDVSDIPAQFARYCSSLGPQDCLQVFMLTQFLLMYLIIPVAIPISIAAYSIVGEKTTRSLEPLLATPITTIELLAGKCLAAVIPAVLTTWGCFAVFLLVMPLVGASQAVQVFLLGPTWMLAIIVIGPLMAVAAVMLSVIVSSRVTDPRAAQQIASVLIVPVILTLFAQLAGFIVINLQFVLVSIGVMAAIDVGLLYIGEELFQREAILTRWK